MTDPFAPLPRDQAPQPRAVHDYDVISPPTTAPDARKAAALVSGLRREPDGFWTYVDTANMPIFHVGRWNIPEGLKTIRPIVWALAETGWQGWKSAHHPEPRPLYNMHELAAYPGKSVVVVEGEKCADIARTVFPSSVVTTWAGGSNAAGKTDWTPLAERQRVLLWPDLDEAGFKAVHQVAGILAGMDVADIRIVDAAALAAERNSSPETGWDVANALEDGWAPEELRRAAGRLAKPYTPRADSADSADSPPNCTNYTICTPSQNFRDVDATVFGTGRTPPPEFPVALLQPFWADWCTVHARTRSAPVDYVAAGLLASAASLIGNARWAQASSEWREPPVLWMALVGAPSSGKSPALDPVLRILRELESVAVEAARPRVQERQAEIERCQAVREAYQAELKQAAKAGTALPDRPVDAIEPEPLSLPRYAVSDITVEKLATILRDNTKGLLVNRDEIAGWVESMGRYSGAAGAERSLWLEAFGGRAFRVDRQSRPEPIIIERLSVSVLGGLQPDRLSIISGGADDGFAARFLFAWPDPDESFRLGQQPVDSGAQRAALGRLADLDLVADEFAVKGPAYVPLSPDAQAILEEFGKAKKREALAATGLLAGALGKAVVQAVRLALVLEYLAWAQEGGREPLSIGRRAMLSGIGLVDAYFIPQARRVFHEGSIPAEQQAAAFVSRYLKDTRTSEFNASRLRRKLNGPVREARMMDAVCDILVEGGIALPTPSRAGVIPGRTTKDFIVNPAILAGDQP